eukprot:COSAG02_NODE_135_length_34565_cov_80.368856_6_plen_74_part_00
MGVDRIAINTFADIRIVPLLQDYVYAVTPLLEDALMDRDLVHRQTAAAAVKHLVRPPAQFGISRSCVGAPAAD